MIYKALPRAMRASRRMSSGIEGVAVWKLGALLGGAVAGAGIYYSAFGNSGKYDAVREEIRQILDDDNWDDGSWGPVFVRLAWHASGTYCVDKKNGGSNGATMRFNPESSFGANAGLDHARNRLESVKEKFPDISYADLWILAGNTAIEEMGGPKLPFRGGRTDDPDGTTCPPDGRLPDGDKGAQHVRDIFYRQGFNDQEIVALVGGGHALGRCHKDRSGFDGPWTRAPTTFSNEFFREVLDNKWTKRSWSGPPQYEDPTKDLMMLETDLVLATDSEFRKYSEIYKDDYGRFAKDFTSAWTKLTENGF